MPTATTAITQPLTELLSHLVRMPTVSDDPATCRAALDWVETQLADLPLTVKRLERNGIPSLIATTPAVSDPKNPRLWLAAHIDVVPAATELFEPQITEHIMRGRGTYDMKSALAVFILLLQEIGPRLSDYNLGLMLTADEEISGKNGVGWLLKQGYRGQAVLLPDSLKTWELETGAKGASFWRFTSSGRDAHGSRIWDGDNAIERLMQFIEILRTQTITEPCGDPAHAHHTLNIGRLEGGKVVNQVPHTAEAHVDIRITPGTALADVAGWVKSAQAAVPGVAAEELPMQANPSSLVTTGPVALFCQLAAAAIGHPIPRVLAHGGTDARWFAELNIPVITLSPRGGGPHTQHEWVDLADLTRYYQITRQFVDEWAKL